MTHKKKRDLRNGLVFISPWIIGFFAFTFYPIVMIVYYSFTEYNIIQPPWWVGLMNFKDLIFDATFWISIYNTLYYSIFSIPLSIILALILALLLNMKLRGMAIYRTIFFLPAIMPVVASSILWLWILNPQGGLINSLLAFMGIKGPNWLASPEWAKPSLILMSLWGMGYTMIILLAGLQDIPQQLYEAAELDGASFYHKLRYITLPLLSPVIFFILIVGVIGAFQYFTQAFIMTNGGPMNTTLFYVLYLYRNAFQYLKMGYASALALILFVIISFSTLLILRSGKKWVHYR